VDDRKRHLWQEALEREDPGRRSAWYPLAQAIQDGLLGGEYAGRWRENGTLVVAVTANPDAATEKLKAVAPSAPVRVVVHEHSLADLEALRDDVLAEADRCGAPWSAGDVDVVLNRVEVMLADLGLPASLRLRERFAGAPVVWQEGTVVAV
jgi:NAD(P)-dependent dehydrogenase (short-subunit alcohol dehydrogenase family)